MIALIPARAGSKRIPGKNTKLLAGHPLIAYTIAAAQESGVFAHIAVSTDDMQPPVGDCTANIAARYGAHVIHRAPESATDLAPDILWVRQALGLLHHFSGSDSFAILRPTSPFRTAATIRRAYEQFRRSEVHSIRAVQPVKEHPYKMWLWEGAGFPMVPFINGGFDSAPFHSQPTQALRRVYVQNSSLEMAYTYVVPAFGTISGTKLAPFFTEGYEGFSIDYPADWDDAERLAAAHPEILPRVDVAALSAPAPAQ